MKQKVIKIVFFIFWLAWLSNCANQECSSTNVFATPACIKEECGDGLASDSEVCDGGDLKGETCASQGFSSGELLCNTTCDGFDTANCI